MPINWSVFWTTIAAFMGASALVGTVALIVWSFDNANYWWMLGIVVLAVLIAMVFGFAAWDADQPGDQMRVCESCSVTMDAEDINVSTNEPDKICPINGAPCNECVPGAYCAKIDGGAEDAQTD